MAVPVVEAQGFTTAVLTWEPWLSPLPLDQANEDQLAVLDESGPVARKSPYYLTLIRQPQLLRHRSAAYNAIMYAPDGLAHADRELAAAAASRVNQCVYCVSVHARRHLQLGGDPALVADLFETPERAGTDARQAAVIAASLKLTTTPEAFDAEDVRLLRLVGLPDIEILDLVHSVAMFAWANRLMMNLGEVEGENAAH